MEKSSDAIEILKEEYGIQNAVELNNAFKQLCLIDLSVFCENMMQQEIEVISNEPRRNAKNYS